MIFEVRGISRSTWKDKTQRLGDDTTASCLPCRLYSREPGVGPPCILIGVAKDTTGFMYGRACNQYLFTKNLHVAHPLLSYFNHTVPSNREAYIRLLRMCSYMDLASFNDYQQISKIDRCSERQPANSSFSLNLENSCQWVELRDWGNLLNLVDKGLKSIDAHFQSGSDSVHWGRAEKDVDGSFWTHDSRRACMPLHRF